MDFTQWKYTQLCDAIVKSKYKSVTVADFIRMSDVKLHNHLIILRHDVDRFPKYALEMAEIEKKFALIATYYFRIPASWNERMIKTIAEMGHEVGLHYECLDKAKGDTQKAGKILEQKLSLFRMFTDVLTVSMHGNPTTKFDNRDMWKHFELNQFGLIGEVYLTMDFEKVMYYSDTGRTWEEGKYNIKDIIPNGMKTVQNRPRLVTTNDLIQLIKYDNRNIYLLIHPNRWPGSFGDWLFSYVCDVATNYGKILYKIILEAKR